MKMELTEDQITYLEDVIDILNTKVFDGDTSDKRLNLMVTQIVMSTMNDLRFTFPERVTYELLKEVLTLGDELTGGDEVAKLDKLYEALKSVKDVLGLTNNTEEFTEDTTPKKGIGW